MYSYKLNAYVLCYIKEIDVCRLFIAMLLFLSYYKFMSYYGILPFSNGSPFYHIMQKIYVIAYTLFKFSNLSLTKLTKRDRFVYLYIYYYLQCVIVKCIICTLCKEIKTLEKNIT